MNKYPQYPECPENREDCRFIPGISITTAMYSPIEYDRKGDAVGGGHNTVQETVQCNSCHKQWSCTGTELDRAQGKKKEWAQS